MNEITYFRLEHVPSHDMSGGLGIFAPTVHSFEISGEPAYWSPAAPNGFAFYYQSFTLPPSPLANSPLLFVWSIIMRLMILIGIHIPEYFQYLILVYLIYPFISLLIFGKLIQLLFRNILVTFITQIIYFFTSLAAWQNAWFSYTESIILFLLFWTLIRLIKFPSLRNYFLLLSGFLFFTMTVNYWTVDDLWLLILCFITGTVFYYRKLIQVLKIVILKHVKLVIPLTVIVFFIGTLWIAALFTVVNEQSGFYTRRTMTGKDYTVSQIIDKAPDIRRFYAELINPFPRIADITNPVNNTMHNARYLGIIILPVFLLSLFIRWRKRELAIVTIILAMTFICSANSLSAMLVEITPMAKRIQQIFEYNTWSIQLFILILSASLTSRMLSSASFYRKKIKLLLFLLIPSISIVMLLDYPINKLMVINATLFSAAIIYSIIVPITFFTLFVIYIVKRKPLILALLICLLLADSARYFRDIEIKDRAMTEGQYLIWFEPPTLPESAKIRLLKPWNYSQLNGFSGAITENMPIANYFWPDNSVYLIHRNLGGDENLQFIRNSRLTTGNPVEFADLLDKNNEPVWSSDTNLLYYNWKYWSYNDHTISFNVQRSGYLVLKIIPDPLWQISVDGKLVNPVSHNTVTTSIRIDAGTHLIKLSYQPLIRKLYLPLMWFSLIIFTTLFILNFRYPKAVNHHL